ncbi:unnamed protein product [Angiostrongylus costaricensis]|uniref:Mab-21 domain-containing protein n=1 Tax=Angiostrongylus costaricensis TaxID=334426 RepID=A0A0R3PCI6_ANGCS|nr:unnamed protein product [Angiostrongylus costaricensis]
MVVNTLYYYLYRGGCCHSNNELIEGIIEEIKNYVFDDRGITLSAQGYSGIPLQGETPLTSRSDDLWKIIDVLFKMSVEFEGLVYRDNLFFREAERNEVLPNWVRSPEDFTQRVYGFDGVLHIVSPELNAKFPTMSDIDIVRTKPRETRNILVTEAVKQRLMIGSSRNFGMQKTSVNLPMGLAYIAHQRPELLSAAIREYAITGGDKDLFAERCLSSCDRVMVHVYLNATDWQTVTAVADIEMPHDIVSHRVSRALIAFDRRHSAIQNGVHVSDDIQLFKRVTDGFERERLSFLFSTLFKTQNSFTHTYQLAKLFLSEKHITQCRKLFKGLYRFSISTLLEVFSTSLYKMTGHIKVKYLIELIPSKIIALCIYLAVCTTNLVPSYSLSKDLFHLIFFISFYPSSRLFCGSQNFSHSIRFLGYTVHEDLLTFTCGFSCCLRIFISSSMSWNTGRPILPGVLR